MALIAFAVSINKDGAFSFALSYQEAFSESSQKSKTELSDITFAEKIILDILDCSEYAYACASCSNSQNAQVLFNNNAFKLNEILLLQ